MARSLSTEAAGSPNAAHACAAAAPRSGTTAIAAQQICDNVLNDLLDFFTLSSRRTVRVERDQGLPYTLNS